MSISYIHTKQHQQHRMKYIFLNLNSFTHNNNNDEEERKIWTNRATFSFLILSPILSQWLHKWRGNFLKHITQNNKIRFIFPLRSQRAESALSWLSHSNGNKFAVVVVISLLKWLSVINFITASYVIQKMRSKVT
jgi:hypothetical protein